MAALNADGYAEINRLSCASAGNCSAGGTYSRTGARQAFAVTQTGDTWGKAGAVPGFGALNTRGDPKSAPLVTVDRRVEVNPRQARAVRRIAC